MTLTLRIEKDLMVAEDPVFKQNVAIVENYKKLKNIILTHILMCLDLYNLQDSPPLLKKEDDLVIWN